MCFVISVKPRFKTAKKRIAIWKHVQKDGPRKDKVFSQFTTPYRGAPIRKNGVIVPSPKRTEIGYSGAYYFIDGGVMHAYNNKESASHRSSYYGEHFVSGYIPKGTKYLSSGNEIVAKKMVLDLSSARKGKF